MADEEPFGYDCCDKCFLIAPIPGRPSDLRKYGWMQVAQRSWVYSSIPLDPQYPIKGKIHLLCPKCFHKWKEENALANIIE